MRRLIICLSIFVVIHYACSFMSMLQGPLNYLFMSEAGKNIQMKILKNEEIHFIGKKNLWQIMKILKSGIILLYFVECFLVWEISFLSRLMFEPNISSFLSGIQSQLCFFSAMPTDRCAMLCIIIKFYFQLENIFFFALVCMKNESQSVSLMVFVFNVFFLLSLGFVMRYRRILYHFTKIFGIFGCLW